MIKGSERESGRESECKQSRFKDGHWVHSLLSFSFYPLPSSALYFLHSKNQGTSLHLHPLVLTPAPPFTPSFTPVLLTAHHLVHSFHSPCLFSTTLPQQINNSCHCDFSLSLIIRLITIALSVCNCNNLI